VDVTVTRPTNATNMQVGKQKVRTTPGHSTHARSRAKHRKYDAIATCNQYQFIPFTMETYGGLGDEALELLDILSKHTKDEYSERQFLSHAFRRLSVTLQKSNANVQSRGMQIMQMGDYTQLLAVRHRPSLRFVLGSGRRSQSHTMSSHRPKVKRRLFIGSHIQFGDVGYDNDAEGDVEVDVTFDYAANLCHVDALELDDGHCNDDHNISLAA